MGTTISSQWATDAKNEFTSSTDYSGVLPNAAVFEDLSFTSFDAFLQVVLQLFLQFILLHLI